MPNTIFALRPQTVGGWKVENGQDQNIMEVADPSRVKAARSRP